MPQPYDLIIVGAGIAGLSVAAHLPREADLNVLVLEARDRLGGRAHTELIDGVSIDLGCSWIHFVAGNPLYALAKKLGLKLGEVDLGDAFDPTTTEQERAVSITQMLFAALFIESDYRARETDPTPEPTESFGDWLREQAKERLEPDELPLFEEAMRNISGFEGATADELSLKYMGFDRGFAGEDQLLLSGYHRIVDYLRKEAQSRCQLRFVLGTPVKRIEDDELNESVNVVSESGEVFAAKQVVVTLPIGVLQAGDVAFVPPLPQRKQRAISNIGSGILNKIVLVYEEAWWDFGSFRYTFFEPEAPLPDCRALGVHAFKGKHSWILQGYINVEDSPAFETLDEQQVAEWGHRVLSKSLRRKAGYEEELPRPTRGFGTRWRTDPYSRCAYSFIRKAQPGEETNAPSPLDMLELSRSGWDGRLGFAGEATSVEHFSYAHGAFLSGKREAERIARELEAAAMEADGRDERAEADISSSDYDQAKL